MKLFKKLSVIALTTSLFLTSALSGSIQSTEAKGKEELKGKIVVAGSSALQPLILQASKEFKKKHPKVTLSVSGSSSIVGPQSVKKGVAQIGACDWDASKDVPGFKAFEGLEAHKVAIIPFATIVNKNVKVDNLTTDQLKDIFAGKIKNWKEVGGEDAEIVVVNRAFGSGTRVNYQQTALKGADFMTKGDNLVEVKSNGDMVTKVGSTPNAIGYTDLVYVKGDIKAIKYNGIAPTIENVTNGKYPVYGTGYLMTKGKPTGATKEFIEYIQSTKFQNGSLKKLKFIPINAMKKK